MPLIPGFEYDIFISYRHKDNKYDSWVTDFVDNLKRDLEVAKANRAKIEAEVAEEKSARMREVSKLTSEVETIRLQRDEYQKTQAKLTEDSAQAVSTRMLCPAWRAASRHREAASSAAFACVR